jgi:thioredoxin 1
MKAITDSSLVAEVANATKPIVIKFEAKWCQPCKAMTPIVLEVEKQFSDQITFFNANVEHCMLITQRYKISQIPALLAMEKGVVTAIKIGVASKSEVRSWIELAFPSMRDG